MMNEDIEEKQKPKEEPRVRSKNASGFTLNTLHMNFSIYHICSVYLSNVF